ncbi:MAG: NAD-dependent epimerase/dehydratase family protein [Lentisphaerales bacterium]|jgi:UDP-glucuronate 4-epimerase|nr:MAG: NAD-dependent epimerase/dehydratase family protein [Lentisphaerales bacterium]
MRILVTGGAGFIGSHLVDRLAGRGDDVVVLDDFDDYYDPRMKRQNLEQATRSGRVSVVEGDIRQASVLDEVCRGQDLDVLVHLAARAGVRPSIEAPLLYVDINCYGTWCVLEAARRHGIQRFVFASSSSVYGDDVAPPFNEDVNISSPLSPYAATKAACELFCRTYYHLHGISSNVLRFFTVYGPRQRPRMAIRKFVELISEGKRIPFYGDGSSERDYTFCTDIIDGLVAAIDRDLGFEIINLGECRTTSLARLVGLIEECVGRKAALERFPDQPGDMKITCADISKARRLLDYDPSVPVEHGIKLFVEWYKRQ